jgi:hypothetical protein
MVHSVHMYKYNITMVSQKQLEILMEILALRCNGDTVVRTRIPVLNKHYLKNVP